MRSNHKLIQELRAEAERLRAMDAGTLRAVELMEEAASWMDNQSTNGSGTTELTVIDRGSGPHVAFAHPVGKRTGHER